nr:MAG TPA: hypothetical protein [Caudoviricetes sp.]
MILALREKIFSSSISRMRKKLCSSSFLLVGSWDKGLYIVAQCSKTFDIVIIQRGFNTLLTDGVQKLRDIGTLHAHYRDCRILRHPVVIIIFFLLVIFRSSLFLAVLLFFLHQVFQLHVEVPFGFIGYNLLHHSCPGCPVAGTLVFENAYELHTTIDSSKIVGEMERVLKIEYHGIYHRGQEYRKDEDGEILHHLCHFLRFQLAVNFASRVFLDSLPIAGIDAAVAPPCRVAVADKGEEAYGDVVKGWFQCTPQQANDGCKKPGKGWN